MKQISAAAKRAASLTRQLLMFSRKQVMQPKVLDLNTVLGNMAKMLHRLLGEDIAFESKYADDLSHRRGGHGDDRADHHESVGQCPRRHAQRRPAAHHDLRL